MIVTNYSGRDVINGAGLIFFIPCMLSALTLWKLIGLDNIFIYIILLLSMTLIGYIDDSLETSTSKGFKGHIKSMMSGTFYWNYQAYSFCNNRNLDFSSLLFKCYRYSLKYYIILFMR